MCIGFDLWYELYENDVETEFTESGYTKFEHEQFVELRYMAFIDEQNEDQLEYEEQIKLSPQDPQEDEGLVSSP